MITSSMMIVIFYLGLELPVENINRSLVIANVEKKIKYNEPVLMAGISE